MLRLLSKILRKFIKILNIILGKLNALSVPKEDGKIQTYQIAKKNEIGKIFYKVKPVTTEQIPLLNIYGSVKGGYVDIEYPEQFFIQVKNATVFPESDFILSGNDVIWDKYYYPSYTKLIPLDKNLVEVSSNTLKIISQKETIYIKKAISLCGVHSKVWSHFLVQYLPKLLYALEIKGFFQDSVTILIPEYNDKHIQDVLSYVTKNILNLNFLTLKDNQSADCELLYYLENTAIISDHEHYMTYLDVIIPDRIAGLLKSRFIDSYLQDNNADSNAHNLKLYIIRNQTFYRRLINVEEVEDFFRKEGFLFVEPHKLTLAEKASLFNNAEIIAGPYSSGFSNALFCKPGTKILALMNLQRCFESYLSFFIKNFKLDFLAVVDTDINSKDSHSDFSIQLSKIKEAYSSFYTQEYEQLK